MTAREECTCIKLPGGGRLPMDDCRVHHDETHGFHTADGEPVVGPSDVVERLKKLRFHPKHHLGLGDIRLTIAQQDELIAEIERLRELLQDVLDETVASSTYPDGPNIDGDLRAQIREALEEK